MAIVLSAGKEPPRPLTSGHNRKCALGAMSENKQQAPWGWQQTEGAGSSLGPGAQRGKNRPWTQGSSPGPSLSSGQPGRSTGAETPVFKRQSGMLAPPSALAGWVGDWGLLGHWVHPDPPLLHPLLCGLHLPGRPIALGLHPALHLLPQLQPCPALALGLFAPAPGGAPHALTVLVHPG